jgi:hypothetical protein
MRLFSRKLKLCLLRLFSLMVAGMGPGQDARPEDWWRYGGDYLGY